MAAHTMQCNVIIPEHTNKQDLTFKNHPEVVSDDFLGDLCVYCCQIMPIKCKPANGPVAGFHFFIIIIIIIFFFFSVPRALVVGLFASILVQLNCAFYEEGNSYLRLS